ncbi:MAG: DUF5695 domain-containing protein [Paenibacillaceae bacterium]
MFLSNHNFRVQVHESGYLQRLIIETDKEQMNWVIDKAYLQSRSFPDGDKLFGLFEIKANDRVFRNNGMRPECDYTSKKICMKYDFEIFSVIYTYSTEDDNAFGWGIELINQSDQVLSMDSFHIWFSLAYIMYKDLDVKRNMNQSCAVFPFISDDYSKFANIRRSNQGPHLGIYNTKGKTLSIGSYCRYENQFLKQVSPSLDGLIYHTLILAGKGLYEPSQTPFQNWIYPDIYSTTLILQPEEKKEWAYSFLPFNEVNDFYNNGAQLKHPVIKSMPALIKGGSFEAEIAAPYGARIQKVSIEQWKGNHDVTDCLIEISPGNYRLKVKMNESGERKLWITFTNGMKDFVIFNVMENIADIIEARADYLCTHSYISDEKDINCFAFGPVSNQGESLGKATFLLTKNLIADTDLQQVALAEKSAVHYIRNKWFEKGDFHHPIKLYGSFYRIYDFDYIAHVFYLLSCFDAEELQLHSPNIYLQWAAELMIVRFDEQAHSEDREKKETGYTGVFVLYIIELLEALKERGFAELYENLAKLWEQFGNRLKEESASYKGAITEHYYDNAGFGPSCEALLLAGHKEEGELYGPLILANIGISNDYRSQNPDRWWESLAYMTHSLWGGLVSHSALKAYEHLRQIPYLHAAYRSMIPIFQCYDWNIRSTEKILAKGEAASTYCVTSPNMNKPSISQNRFGQSVFMDDEAEIFAGSATGDDWDMGAELATYLVGFGSKTYLYYEGQEIKCINGYLSEEEGRLVVTSCAAYPKQYYFFEESLSLIAEKGEIISQVYILNNKMHRMDHR